MDEQIASVSIGCGIDLTGVMRDLDRISKMTSQVKMAIGVGFDDRQVSTQINRLAQSVSRTVIRPTVDHKPFVALNKHIALKDKDIKALAQTYKKTVIAPVVDDRAFAKLDQSIDRATAKLKNLEATAKQVQAIGSIRIDASGTVGGRSSSSTSSSSRSGDDRKLAQEIGREVAKNIGKGSIGGTLKTIASIPLRIAGNAAGKVAEGITYGITQEVSKGLGKGLSTAIEATLFKGVGSSELAAEKLGSALAESLMGSFNKQMKGIVKFDENDNPLLPKFLSDNIKNPRQRANLRKFYKELIDTAKAGQQELINTLGGQDTIAEESLAVRGRARSDRRSRRPVAQEQAAYERQQAYRRESDIRSRVPQRLAEVEQDLAEAKEESRQIQEQYKQIEKEVLKAEKFAEEAGKRRAKAQQAYGAGLIDKAELKKAEDLEKKFKDRAAEVSKRITQPILEPKFQQQYQSEFQKYQKDLEAAQKKYQETLNQRNKARENFAKGYLSRDQLKIFEDAETNAQVELTKRSQPFRAPQLEKRLQSQLEDSRAAIAQVRQKRRQGGLSTEEEFSLDKLESVSQQRIKEAERNMFSLGERMQQVGSRIGGLTSYRNFLKAAEQQAVQAKKEADARFESLLPETTKIPKTFQDLIETVTGQSILDIDPEKVPQIKAGKVKENAYANYDVRSNTINVSPDYLEALQSGQLSDRDRLTGLHELQHGKDLDFGSFRGMVARRMGKPINPATPTIEEFQDLAPYIAQYDPSVRELELNAELMARRNAKQLKARETQAQIRDQQYEASRRVTDSRSTIKSAYQSLSNLKDVAKIDPAFAEEIGATIQSYASFLLKLDKQFTDTRNEFLSIDPSTIEDVSKFLEVMVRSFQPLTRDLKDVENIVQQFNRKQLDRLNSEYGDPFTGQLRKRRYPMETDDDRFPAPATESFLNAPDVWNIQDPGSSVQSVSTPPNKPQTFMGKASNFAYNAGQKTRQGLDAITSLVQQANDQFDAFGLQVKQGYNIASGVAQRIQQTAEDFYEAIAPVAEPLGKAAVGAAKSLTYAAKVTYKLAEGLENGVLTLTPYGHAGKGFLKNTAVPMGLLAAVEHYVPGVSQTVDLFGNMATHAIEPIAQGYGDQLLGGAANFIQHTVPNWGGMQTHAIQALQGGVEGLASGGARMLGQTGATLAAGRMIQTGVEQSFKQMGEAAAPSKTALPSVQQPLNLSSADKEIVLASGEIQKASSQISSHQQQGKKAKKVAIDAAKKAGEVSRSLLDATIATIRSADEAMQEAQKLSQKFWDAHNQIKQLSQKKQLSQADIEKAKAYLSVIQNAGKNAIADIGYMAQQLGDLRYQDSIGSRLSNRQSQITRAQKNAQKLVRKMKPNEVPSDAIDVSSVDAPLERLKEEQIRAMAKDLVVNTAGFAASTALGDQGIVAQLAGDLGGALVARQAVNMGEAGVTAYNQLKDDDLFKAADALKKFTMIVQQASKVMQSADFQEMQGNEIFGDLTGFGIGNAAATLLGGVPGVGDIPMKGAAAAMAIVPQLAKLRDGIRKQLATIEQDVQRAVSSPDAPLERLKFGRQGLNPDDAGDEDQKNFLENILALLDDAIAKANQFDDAFKKVKQTGYQGTNATQEELQNLEKRVKTDPRLKFSYRGVDRKPQNAAEAEFLKHIEDLLVDATIASQRFEQAFKKLDQPSLQKLQESLKSADQAFDEDGKAIVAEVQREIANYESIVAELDENYRQRSMAAAEKLKEQVEYRRAYAEMMGVDPDSAEGMAGLDIPMPQEEGAIGQFFKALKGDADDLVKSIGGIPGMAKKAIGGLLGFIALNTLLPVLRDFAASSVEAAREFERFERTLGFITGSADKAQSVLAGLRAESKALGIDLRGAIAGQTQLMAATRGTALEGAATEQIGAATRQAASVYGLTPEQFDRMNIAISQMASKGKVSAEELRCFSTGTEVLTDKGWMRWEDVDETCLFISRNLKTGEVEYQKPKRLIRFHYKGKMFKVKNDRVDLLVTPEHRMVVREEGDTEYKIVEARDLEDKPYYYLTNIDGTEEAIVYPKETEWVDYDDEAFCAEVPFTTLFVRRSGGTCWSGNSQLGEVLPGAFTIFARAIGVSTAQLDKMLERGEVGTDAIVKFAQQLQSETSTGVAGAANSAQASLNRFNTSVYALQVAFGKTLLPAQSLGLDALTKALEVLQDLIPTITTAVTILGARLALSLGASALKAVGATTSLQGALMALPGALRGIYAAIAPLAAQFLAFALIGDMFNSIRQEMSDSAEASREFADSATEGLQKYLEVTGQATDQTKELAKALESLPQSRAESSFVTGGVYKGLMGEEGGTSYLRELEQYQASGGTQMTFDLYRMFGKTPPMRGDDIAKVGPTQPLSEKRAQDIIAATQEGLNSTDALFDRSQSMLDRYQQGGGDLRRIRELDIRARDLQGQRALLPAADTEGRRKIDAEYNKILEDRNKLAEGFTTLQSELSTRVEAMKKTREELEDTLSKGGLSKESRAELEKQLSQVNAELERGLKLQDAQNKAINTAIESAAKLQIKFEAIVASLDILNTQSQTLNSQALAGISQAQLSGNMTPGQAQAALADAEQANLARTIENLNTGITKLNDLIGSTANSRALAFAGLSPDVDALTLSEKIAELRGQGVNEDSEEFKTLTGLQQQLNQRDQLKMQVAQSQQQQAQVAAQTAESIRDANKQVLEFYRNVQRQTEDLQIVLEQQQFETKMQNLRNDLNRSLSGFSDVFFGDMWSSLNELFDFATERSRLMTENAQREAEVQRQAIDTTRQGNEQIRTTYGGSTVPFQGVQVTSAVDASGEPGLDYVVSDGQRGAQFGALSPGEVIEVRRDDRELGTGGERGYGNTVIVRTVDQVSGEIVDMLYAHLDDIMVQVGQQVGVGSVLGTQGRTGSTTGAHVSVDFFGKDSASATSASLSMRDRIAATLVNNPDSLNQLIQSPIGQAVGGGLQTTASIPSGPQYIPQGGPVGVAERVQSDPTGAAAIVATAQRLGLDPMQFAALMSWESAGTLNPNVTGGDGGVYQGLIQFSPDNQNTYGITPNMSIADQMPLIEQYLLDRGFVPGQMDIRGAYSAILAGNASEQYWDSADSNGTTVRNAAGKFSSGDHYDRAMQFLQASGVTPSAGGQFPTSGSVNTAPITAATSQAQVNAQAAIASADAQLQSNLDRLAIQEEQAKRRADRQRQEGLDRIAQQNTELRRQQDETILGAFGDSEAAGVLRELRANNNQLTDATLAQQRQLRDLSDTIANTETYIDFYEQNPTAPGADQLPKLQEALTQVQSEYDTLKALVERQTSVSSQERTRILEQRQQQLLERSRASDLETLGLQNQLSIVRTPEGLGRELLQSSQATNDILREYTTRSNELRKKAEELQATLDETIASGVEYSADELEAVKQEIQANLNEAVALDNQATLKVEIELENRQQVIDQFAEDLGSRARDAQVQYLQNRGDTFGANEVQRRYAMDQQAIQYQQDASQLDAMALESGADLGQISQMRSDLEALNQFNLDNLRMQFPDLADSINSTAFQAFQNLGTSIADVFANAKSGEDILKGLGQAFQQFASQIISSLLNMAAQAAASELFGLFFPQKGGASGGGLGSLFGTLAGGVSSLGGASFESTGIPTGGFNLGGTTGGGGGFNWGSLVSTGLSLIGGFDKGGLIPGTYTGTPDQHIARVNPGEYVLNRESVQRIGVTKLDALNNIKGFNRLPRFNDGGYRDYASSPSRSYRDYSAESDGRSGSSESSGGPIEVKLDTEVVNNIEYARKEEVEEAMKRAAEEGAKKGEERVRRGISKNPSYRQGMGIR